MLRLQNSNHAAAQGVFDTGTVESTLEQYGIDWEGPCPDNETDSDCTCVTVPRINLHLPSNILQNLYNSVDPLAPSELYGMDIYLICLRLLQDVLKNIQPINIESR